MPNLDSSDSDCDNSGKRIRYLPKKLIKKRNYVVEKGEKVKTYFILRTVPFKVNIVALKNLERNGKKVIRHVKIC